MNRSSMVSCSPEGQVVVWVSKRSRSWPRWQRTFVQDISVLGSPRSFLALQSRRRAILVDKSGYSARLSRWQ